MRSYLFRHRNAELLKNEIPMIAMKFESVSTIAAEDVIATSRNNVNYGILPPRGCGDKVAWNC